ncbi:MAG: TonB-dependent receptor domain-containing protein [Candidatus Tyrphobacter sp.]
MIKVRLLAIAIVACLPAIFATPASAQIAPGVTQSAAHIATVTGRVLESTGTPVAGAEVKLSGPAAVLTTRTHADGSFIFTAVPWGAYTVLASSPLGIATRSGIAVKGDIVVSIEYLPSSNLRTIAHVSTRSSGAHINVTPASISSVSPSDFAFQGNTSWTQLLNRVPGVVVNGDAEGGEQINNTLSGSLIYAQVISINGALPYETSVSLDGMPLTSQTTAANPGTGYDLSNLPLTIFPQADVVRGPGANAPSIEDSIGGSFVLHPPGAVDQNRSDLSISNDPWGGTVGNFRIAQRFGRLSATVTYGVNDSPGYYGNAKVVNAFSGLEAPMTVNGQPFVGCANEPFAACGSGLPCNVVPGEGNVTYGYFNNCGYEEHLLVGGVPFSTAWSQHAGAVSLAYEIARGITAQIFYAGTSGSMEDPFVGALTQFSPAAGYTGPIRAGYYNMPAINPYTINQGSSILEEKVHANLGSGVLTLAAVQNYSWSFSNSVYSSMYPSNQAYQLYGTACLGAAGPSASCPFGGTPTTFNGTNATLTYAPQTVDEDFWSRNRDMLASYETQVGNSLNVGASYLYSYYNSPDYLPAKIFGIGSLLLEQVDSANSMTLDELRINAGASIGDRWNADLSWYVAQGFYHLQTQDTGNRAAPWVDSHFPYSAPRLGLTYRINPNFVLRAAAGGGYALPPIDDLLGRNLTPLSCQGTVCSETLNNYRLQPETSFGYDVGTDMRLNDVTTLSFDLYRTDLYGQFFQTTTTTTYSGPGCGAPPCFLGIEQYNNLQHSRYEGLNFSIQRQPDRGFYWQASVGLTRAYIVSLPPGFYSGPGCPTSACQNVFILPNINFNGATQAGLPPQPYANGGGIIGYRWREHEFVDVWPTYYGNGNAYFQPAFMEFDAHASYPVGKYVALLFTMRNFTAVHEGSFQYLGPPAVGAPTLPGNYPYPLYAIPYGPRALVLTFQYTGP